MFYNTDIIKLKELQRIRRQKLKEYGYGLDIQVSNYDIDLLLVYFDESEANKEVFPDSFLASLSNLKQFASSHLVYFHDDDIEYLNYIIGNYRYSEKENKKIIEKLVKNKDVLLNKDIFIGKDNLFDQLSISQEEETKLRKSALFTTSSKHIDQEYMIHAIDEYMDAYQLFYQKYNDKPIYLEFNGSSIDNRYWVINFRYTYMPHILGLPGYDDYKNLNFVRRFSKNIMDRDSCVINDFYDIILRHKKQFVQFEMKRHEKFNWEKLRCKTSFFKNFGTFNQGDICVYKFGSERERYVLKRSGLSHDYLELALMHPINYQYNSFIPKSLRLISDDNNTKGRLFLGLASNLSHESPEKITISKVNHDNHLFNVDDYLILNQEKIYGSFDLICEVGNIYDSVLLKGIDLDYLFASFQYDEDSRRVCNKEEMKKIEQFYQNIKKGPLSLPNFKDIAKLSRSVKLKKADNAVLINRIKNILYRQNTTSYGEQFSEGKTKKYKKF